MARSRGIRGQLTKDESDSAAFPGTERHKSVVNTSREGLGVESVAVVTVMFVMAVVAMMVMVVVG